MIATVQDVRDDRLGGELTANAAISATSLQVVNNALDFEEFGGSLVLNGSVLSYLAVDFNEDADIGTITLAAGLASAASTGDWVAPYSGNAAQPESTVRYAMCDMGPGDALQAIVPHSLRPLLPLGIRDPGTEEVVDIWEPEDGQWEVRTIRGR